MSSPGETVASWPVFLLEVVKVRDRPRRNINVAQGVAHDDGNRGVRLGSRTVSLNGQNSLSQASPPSVGKHNFEPDPRNKKAPQSISSS